MSAHHHLLLDAIEIELKALAWWETTHPGAEALASSEPFCLDTLDFSQWLQFVLLARLRAMLDAKMPLPSNIAVYPMAFETFKSMPEDTTALTEAIAQLDEGLSGQPVTREA